jgi:Skp family chaperone for outer membrane proteins
MAEQEIVIGTSLTSVMVEDATIKKMAGNVTAMFSNMSAMYKEFKAMQEELKSTKETLEQTLISQQERVAIRKLELDNECAMEKVRYDKAREQESHQWERSLPLESDKTEEILKVITEVKSLDIKVVKTGKNLKSDASGDKNSISVEDLLKAFQIPLAKLGINIHHSLIAGFEARNDDILKTELKHRDSGQFICSYSKVRLDFVDGTINAQQKRSSAISYAKRHNLQCLLGQ